MDKIFRSLQVIDQIATVRRISINHVEMIQKKKTKTLKSIPQKYNSKKTKDNKINQTYAKRVMNIKHVLRSPKTSPEKRNMTVSHRDNGLRRNSDSDKSFSEKWIES